jgi:dihydroorotase
MFMFVGEELRIRRVMATQLNLTSPGVLTALLAVAALIAAPVTVFAQDNSFDVVLAGGRVIDPESGLDAIRHVGIRGDRILAVSEQPLDAQLRPGGTRLDVTKLVVAPGFIDLHAHGQSARANEFQVRDGVTTALELEFGFPQVERWLASRKGKALIHYGVSVSHAHTRTLALPDFGQQALAELAAMTGDFDAYLFPQTGTALMRGLRQPLPENLFPALRATLDRGLEEGALGIGLAYAYCPGAKREEILRVFQFAAERGVPIFTHVRSTGIEAIQEVIDAAAATGASLHIVHINSSSLDKLPVALELIRGAQSRGVDVTTEAYPYTAGSTLIQSPIFDEGWRERRGIDYSDLQWQATGERLTEESFRRYRDEGGTVIIHMMKEPMIELALRTPFVMIASDGMPYAPGAHPRLAGTFSRILGRYVRERGALGLTEAIRKITLMPAQRLEAVAPGMRNKGRIRVGADADVTVFDAANVRDTATYESGPNYSEGIRHVLVAGTLVVEDGVTVQGVFPGRAILGHYKVGE